MLWSHELGVAPHVVVVGVGSMAKTYVPQFIRFAQRMSVYYSKHQALMLKAATDPQLSACLVALGEAAQSCSKYYSNVVGKP